MRQITELSWITKTKAKLYLDYELCFVITKKDVIDYGFRENGVIEDDVFECFYREVMEKRAKQKALTLLNGKDYSEHELFSKIERDFLSTALATCAVDYVKGYHYIDDARYASNFITYQSQNMSRQQIMMKLKTKGISDEVIESALDELHKDDRGLLEKLIMTKFKDYPEKSKEEQQKIMTKLLRKGFRYGDIKGALAKLSENSYF